MKKITLIIPVLLTLLLSCDVVSKVEEDRWPEDATPFTVNVSPGDTTLHLNWSFVENAAVYEVWYNTIDDYSTAIRSGGDITTTSYTIIGLTNGFIYHLWVIVKNAEGLELIRRAVTGMPNPAAMTSLATVYTTSIAGNPDFAPSIAGVSALAGGEVTSQGSSPVTDRGVCWSTNPDPTILNSHVSDMYFIGTGTYTQCSIWGLNPDTTYYVRAYATNASGTAYGANTSFNSGKRFRVVSPEVGGYVFYNDGFGRGFVAAETDITMQEWTPTLAYLSNTETGIGKGRTNSASIVASYGVAVYAAKSCDDYLSYLLDDWFLPSRDELYLMRKNLYPISLIDTLYWTSCQGSLSPDNAEAFDFANNVHTEQFKSNFCYIRPVREF